MCGTRVVGVGAPLTAWLWIALLSVAAQGAWAAHDWARTAAVVETPARRAATSQHPRPRPQQQAATLSNTELLRDTTGALLLTGEADILVHPTDGHLYFYFNDWGGCPDVNCCGSTGGCASCCFHESPPDPRYPDACVYTTNHTIVAYRTSDLQAFEFLGAVLPPSARHAGIEFRPRVVYNVKTELFVMWYEDRWDGQEGYAVATAKSAAGPFVTLANTVRMATPDKIGDFDILVDDDGIAYHVRTGFAVEQLNADYTGVSGKYTTFTTPKRSEGPVFFKRSGVYYILPGTTCCACLGGSSMYVFTSNSPMGPFTYRGEVAANTTDGHTFDIHSPFNYNTHAQASAVVRVPRSLGRLADGAGASASGRVGLDADATYLWMGNQWDTSQEVGHPRHHDLLYWWPLGFSADGNVTKVEWADSVTIPLA